MSRNPLRHSFGAFLHSCFSGAFPYWMCVIRTLEEPVRVHSFREELVELLIALVLAIVLITVVGERIA